MSLHFDENRTLATQIGTLGTSVGQFAFPVIITPLVAAYSLKVWISHFKLLSGIHGPPVLIRESLILTVTSKWVNLKGIFPYHQWNFCQSSSCITSLYESDKIKLVQRASQWKTSNRRWMRGRWSGRKRRCDNHKHSSEWRSNRKEGFISKIKLISRLCDSTDLFERRRCMWLSLYCCSYCQGQWCRWDESCFPDFIARCHWSMRENSFWISCW